MNSTVSDAISGMTIRPPFSNCSCLRAPPGRPPGPTGVGIFGFSLQPLDVRSARLQTLDAGSINGLCLGEQVIGHAEQFTRDTAGTTLMYRRSSNASMTMNDNQSDRCVRVEPDLCDNRFSLVYETSSTSDAEMNGDFSDASARTVREMTPVSEGGL